MSLYSVIGSLLFNNVEQILSGLSWVVISSIGILLGALVVTLPFSKIRIITNVPIVIHVWLKTIRLILIISITIGIVGIIVTYFYVRSFGNDMGSDNFFLDTAMATSKFRSDIVYGIRENRVDQYIFSWVGYIGSLLGGHILGLSKRRIDRLLGLMPILMMYVMSTLTASRMGSMYATTLSLGAWLATIVLISHGTIGKNIGPIIRRVVVLLFIAIVFAFIATSFRYIDQGSPYEIAIWRNIAEPFSYIHSFSIWIDKGFLEKSDLLFGYRTFWGLYNKLGHRNVQQYSIDTLGLENNILTALQGLLEDFGKIGFLLIMLLSGMVATFAYLRVINGQTLWVPTLATIYAAIFLCPVFSITQYNQPIFAICLFQLFIFLMVRRIRKNRISLFASHPS